MLFEEGKLGRKLLDRRKKIHSRKFKVLRPAREIFLLFLRKKMRVKASRVLESSALYFSAPSLSLSRQNKEIGNEKRKKSERIHIIIRRSVKVGEKEVKRQKFSSLFFGAFYCQNWFLLELFFGRRCTLFGCISAQTSVSDSFSDLSKCHQSCFYFGINLCWNVKRYKKKRERARKKEKFP